MITPATLEFLSKLKNNNSKEWFDKNRPTYELIKVEFKNFVQDLIVAISKFDSSVKHLEAKNCVFRINRDVRFSNDKSPYKTNIGAYMSPEGKKSFSAGYYIHIQPNNCFLASGMWMPPAPQLIAVRQEIDYNADEFRKIVSCQKFISHFKTLSQEDKVKTSPKGYDKAHPEIEFLKLKSFIAIKSIKDKEVLSKTFIKNCAESFEEAYPLNQFLRRACD
ncbi:MAG: DUF2461 domain-containing protein [Bacteroidia bacterium]|nr:DUF2461 domain-containing protein [Bacteroidia bacterium]